MALSLHGAAHLPVLHEAAASGYSKLVCRAGHVSTVRTSKTCSGICNVRSARIVQATSGSAAVRKVAGTRSISVRADAHVNAVAVDKPAASSSAGSKEKVKIGINGKQADSQQGLPYTTLSIGPCTARFRQNWPLSDSSSDGE